MISVEQSGGLAATFVALGFALLARVLRVVTDGGALFGAGIAFVLMLAGGLWAFLPLFAVLIVTMLATRWRSDRKMHLGIAERTGGRNALQVLANLGASGLCAIASIAFPRQSATLLIGAMAALAEAAADTVSSEAGQAVASSPRMIVGLQPVAPGTNGAVSLEGTLAGCIAASLTAWNAALAGVVELRWAPVIAVAGVGGMLFDSLLGACFENRGRMGNDSVNFVSTVFAADIALIAVLLLSRC